jgi:hypothetical protein
MTCKDLQEQEEIGEMLSGLSVEQVREMLLKDMASTHKTITKKEIQKQIKQVKGEV